jgi:hypothetical protein
LIAMGLQLMQAKGRGIFPALGQAGMVGVQATEQERQAQAQRKTQQMQQQMMQYQLASAKREQDIAALPQQFYRAPSEPAVDGTGGMDTAVEAPRNASGPGGFDMQGYLQRLQGMDFGKYLATVQAMQKDESPIPVPEGTVLLNRKTNQPIYSNPKSGTGEHDAIVRVMREAGISPASPQGQAIITEWLKKQSTPTGTPDQQNYSQYVAEMTRAGKKPLDFMAYQTALRQAGAQTISLGSPVPVMLPDGNGGQMPALVQPPNKPGGQPQVVTIPVPGKGNVPVQPAKDPGKLTESEGNASAFLMRATNALKYLDNVPTVSAQDYYLSRAPAGVGNFAMSSQGQQAMNAEKQFIAAVLRKESGAAISAGEYKEYGDQFFPRPGDSPEKLAQKAQNRRVALEGMRVQAGPEGAKRAAAGLDAASGSSSASSPVKRFNPQTGRIE